MLLHLLRNYIMNGKYKRRGKNTNDILCKNEVLNS